MELHKKVPAVSPHDTKPGHIHYLYWALWAIPKKTVVHLAGEDMWVMLKSLLASDLNQNLGICSLVSHFFPFNFIILWLSHSLSIVEEQNAAEISEEHEQLLAMIEQEVETQLTDIKIHLQEQIDDLKRNLICKADLSQFLTKSEVEAIILEEKRKGTILHHRYLCLQHWSNSWTIFTQAQALTHRFSLGSSQAELFCVLCSSILLSRE